MSIVLSDPITVATVDQSMFENSFHHSNPNLNGVFIDQYHSIFWVDERGTRETLFMPIYSRTIWFTVPCGCDLSVVPEDELWKHTDILYLKSRFEIGSIIRYRVCSNTVIWNRKTIGLVHSMVEYTDTTIIVSADTIGIAEYDITTGLIMSTLVPPEPSVQMTCLFQYRGKMYIRKKYNPKHITDYWCELADSTCVENEGEEIIMVSSDLGIFYTPEYSRTVMLRFLDDESETGPDLYLGHTKYRLVLRHGFIIIHTFNEICKVMVDVVDTKPARLIPVD